MCWRWTKGKGSSPVPVTGQPGMGHGFSSPQKLFQLLVSTTAKKKWGQTVVFEIPFQTWIFLSPSSCCVSSYLGSWWGWTRA